MYSVVFKVMFATFRNISLLLARAQGIQNDHVAPEIHRWIRPASLKQWTLNISELSFADGFVLENGQPLLSAITGGALCSSNVQRGVTDHKRMVSTWLVVLLAAYIHIPSHPPCIDFPFSKEGRGRERKRCWSLCTRLSQVDQDAIFFGS